MSKILILVLSYNEPPYSNLMDAQMNSWDATNVDDVKTIYYHGGNENAFFMDVAWRERAMFHCTDSYYYMSEKFKMALDHVKEWDYDIIFRTNSSSYVSKQRLKEFAEKLPKEGLYAGWEIEGNAGYNIISGAGIFLSRDTAEILRKGIDPEFEREEDVYCGQILSEHGIKIIDDKSRFDVFAINNNIPLDKYHYRFKTADRLTDASNMKLLHKKIINHNDSVRN